MSVAFGACQQRRGCDWAAGEFFLEDLTPVSDRPHEIEIKLEIGRDGMLAAQAQSLADGTKADLTVTYESNTKGE